MRYEFEDVVVDVETRELYRGGELVAVEPQVFDVLEVLLENRDRLVPKAELIDTIWGDRFVAESALSSRITFARRAVGDNGRDQRIIRTVHGRGFRFVAEIVGGDLDVRLHRQRATPAPGSATEHIKTLLLCDIDGAPKIRTDTGGAIDDALRRYEAIVDGVIVAHSGRIFSHANDGIGATFDTAISAFDAAVAIQVELSGQRLSLLEGSGIRVALHTGLVSVHDVDVSGPAVRVAEILLGTANGGQVVASEPAVHAHGPARQGISTQNAGAFNLSGVGDHVILYLVEAPPIRADRRPLKADIGARTNLPRRRQDLIGREDDLARLVSRLSDAAVVSVVGPGGVGKTTLAMEAGRLVLGAFTGGTWVCELANVDSDNVPAAVLGALEGNAGGGPVAAAQIVDRLGPDPALLILDNCEHVIDAVTHLVEEVLDAHRTLSVMTTSREPLATRGEVVIRIEGLDRSDVDGGAVELFQERAGDATGLTGTDAERAVILQIVDRLEGLPLAIELAAPRLVSSTPQELLEALDDQMTVLASRRHDGRQTAMDRAISWSYDLLADNERKALRELSIFSGPFTLDAAQSVISAAAIPQAVHRLVEQSMVTTVQTDFGTRFRLLEPVRQYVEQQVDQESGIRLARAHAEYFAPLVVGYGAQLRTSGEPEAAASLTLEWPDVGRALAWGRQNERADIAVQPLLALDVHLLWQLRIEAFGWLAEAAEVFGPLGPAADTLLGLAAWSRGDLAQASHLAEQAEAEGGDTPALAILRTSIAMAKGDMSATRRESTAMYEMARRVTDPSWQILAAGLRLIGEVLADDPTSVQVDEYANQVDELMDASDWPTGLAMGLLSHVVRSMRIGDAASMETFRTDLHRVSSEGGAPWFAYIASSIASPDGGSADPAARLEAAVESLRSAVAADDRSQLPVILRTVVVGLDAVGYSEDVARLAGLIPQIRGVGEGGQFSPGYDDAIARARGVLGDEDFEHLVARGRRMSLSGAMSAADDALRRASSPSQATNP